MIISIVACCNSCLVCHAHASDGWAAKLVSGIEATNIRRIPFLDSSFGIFSLFAGLGCELLNNSVIVSLGLKSESSLLAFDAFNFNFVSLRFLSCVLAFTFVLL